jgi:hypothetical protein
MDPIDDRFDMNKVSNQYWLEAVLRAWTHISLSVTGVTALWSVFATLKLICVEQFYLAYHVFSFALLCLPDHHLCVHLFCFIVLCCCFSSLSLFFYFFFFKLPTCSLDILLCLSLKAFITPSLNVANLIHISMKCNA